MANAATLIFPHQLFQNHPALQKSQPVYLVEEWLFFKQYHFHKQKLVLQRASMKFYENWLLQNNYTVYYIETSDAKNDCTQLVAALAIQKISHIHIAALADDWLHKRMQQACKTNGISLTIYPSPNFLNTAKNVDAFFNNRKTYFQTDFYIWQRKQRNMLLGDAGKPLGGKWTFDEFNREKFPQKGKVPALNAPVANAFITEAKQYIQQHFANNYGAINGPCLYVVTFEDAENWLDDFLQNRFEHFGKYEDAIVANEAVLHHSVLTPMLNIGLLHPQQIIDKALLAAQKNNTPLHSVEGFIRQIIGWREFMQIVYHREGGRQRSKNYWGFTRKIPPAFWTGNTGIEPIDTTIKKLLQTGYCHHIERLMVLGNFMLLCEFNPNEVYRWFMEMFVDAYDWVMVPNVYGMTQFADGGLITTKPYISGSNYLIKMSNYPKGNWQTIWDGLFWRFMHTHRSFFLQNPRLGMLLSTFDKMPTAKQQAHLTHAEAFLKNIDAQNGDTEI